MSEKKKNLNKLIVNTVDEELKKIFGETATLVIYGYLENNFSLKREKIPEKLETFMEGLHDFFRSGAHMIEQSILEELHVRLGLEYKSREGYKFMDYLDDLENVYHAIKNSPKNKWLQRALPKT